MLLDYHAKYLLPAVWSEDGTLTKRFSEKVKEIINKFPLLTDLCIIGDAVSHYWQHDSPIDIVVFAPEKCLCAYRRKAEEGVSSIPGYENTIHIFVIRSTLNPDVMSRHFGAMFSVVKQRWYGKFISDQTELIQPEELLKYIHWRIYRERYTTNLDFLDWRIVKEAFIKLKDGERQNIIDAFKNRIAVLEASIHRKIVKQPKEVMQYAEIFEEKLYSDEEVPDEKNLPTSIATLLVHKIRYILILEDLEDIHNMMLDNEERPVSLFAAVLVEGGKKSIHTLNSKLRAAGFDTTQNSTNSLLVYDVYDGDIEYLKSLVSEHDNRLNITYNPEWSMRIHAETGEESKSDKNNDDVNIDVVPGKWYAINDDVFPVLIVERIWHDEEGNSLYDVSLHRPGGKEMPVTLPAHMLADLSPKLANSEDFSAIGMIPPHGIDISPHM